MLDLTESEAFRFWAKVNPRDESGCWEWAAGRDEGGYGLFGIRSRNMRAHRLSYEITIGAIPDGVAWQRRRKALLRSQPMSERFNPGKPSPNEPRKLAAYTKGYAVGFSGEPDENPWRNKDGNPNRGFEDAWREGYLDGWDAGRMARSAKP